MSDDQDSCLRNVKPATTGSGEPQEWRDKLLDEKGYVPTPPASQPTVTTLKELSEDYRWEAANIVRFFDHPGMTTEQKVEFLAKELAGVHLWLYSEQQSNVVSETDSDLRFKTPASHT